jgi:threonine-phosphate decarboxylase
MPVSDHSHSIARDICADVDRRAVESQVDREHGGDVHAWAKQARIDPAEIIDFSATINPLGPPASVRKAFQKSYEEIPRYPDPYGQELKEALAKRHEMKPEELLLGNGSTQLIYLLCFALRPRKALVVGPAFSEHANALTLAGAKVRFLPLTADGDFRFSTEEFMAAWGKADDMAFVTTPNSVTGQLIPRAEIEKIARIALIRRRFLVVDEAFMDFAEGESVKQLIRDNPYLIILRSLTKFYALPGLRLGYLLAHSRRVAQFAAYLEPWSVNGPAQKVALACLADRSFGLKTERWLRRERIFLTQALIALKRFQPYPSSANFLLVRIANDNSDALELRYFLLGRKILIRACNSFAGLGTDHFRVAVLRRKDNRRLLEALTEWTAQLLP